MWSIGSLPPRAGRATGWSTSDIPTPSVWQAWAKDEEGRLYRFAELYHTGLLVEEAAGKIKEWMSSSGEDFPEALLCDHDAEGRATLEKHLGVPPSPPRRA